MAWEASRRLEMQAANGVSLALIVLPPARTNQERDGSSMSQQIGRPPGRKNPRHGKGLVGMQESLNSQPGVAARAASRYRLHSGARPGVPLLRMVGKRQEQQTTGISPRSRQSPRRAARLHQGTCRAVSRRRHLATLMMVGASPALMVLRCAPLNSQPPVAGRRVTQPHLPGKRRSLAQ